IEPKTSGKGVGVLSIDPCGRTWMGLCDRKGRGCADLSLPAGLRALPSTRGYLNGTLSGALREGIFIGQVRRVGQVGRCDRWMGGDCGWSPIFLIGRGWGWLDIGVDAEGLEWDVAEL
ncbi:hypothetical protein, partial [uncultured Porphyromonas sp.]|uniref:hypothetical protein n=1 Tax=uncultured Porphyromonas sp. TaxID=159274 RepID=UPI0027DB1304